MRLEEIGFYTLSEARVRGASATSALARCELLLTSRCNFRCPYCRGTGGADLPWAAAARVVDRWAADGLRAVRFSGGEPLLWGDLARLVARARARGIAHIAISSNGSMPWAQYEQLLGAGANDFSISLDACCAADGQRMAGGVGAWAQVVANLRALAPRAYVTAGVVLTEANRARARDIVRFASELGVADVRVIPAAQCGAALAQLEVDGALLARHPILAYRVRNAAAGRPVRGLRPTDSGRCALALDDMVVCGGHHYPCVIHLREGGRPIGRAGAGAREERARWVRAHDGHADPICAGNCLDVCVDYNNRFRAVRGPGDDGARP